MLLKPGYAEWLAGGWVVARRGDAATCNSNTGKVSIDKSSIDKSDRERDESTSRVGLSKRKHRYHLHYCREKQTAQPICSHVSEPRQPSASAADAEAQITRLVPRQQTCLKREHTGTYSRLLDTQASTRLKTNLPQDRAHGMP